MNFLKKFKKVKERELQELVILSGSMVALLVVAVSFNSSSFAHTLALTGPGSQTANVLPCGWFGDCGATNDPHFGLTANTYAISSPGQAVTLTWTAYNGLIGTGLTAAACTSNPTPPPPYYCYISNYGPVGDYTFDTFTSTRSGSVVVHPTQTTTYSLVGTRYFAYYGGGNFYTATWPGSPSVTITLSPPPQPTTFNSFTSTDTAVPSGGSTNLHWSYTPGTNFYGCEIVGGNWPSGYYWLPANDSGVSNSTGAITTPATFQINCYDNNAYGWGAWHPLTIGTVTLAPVSADATITSSVTVGQSATISFHADSTDPPTQCQINNYNDTLALKNTGGCPTSANQTYTTPVFTAPGTYSYRFFYYRSGVWTLVKTLSVNVSTDVCTDISGQQTSLPTGCTGPTPSPSGSCIPANGTYNGFQCVCPQYTTLQGSTCVLPTNCPNGLPYNTYGPTCTCPSGQVQSGSTCVLPGVINSLTANPTRVRKGNTSAVTWSTSNMATCSLAGPNPATGIVATLSTALSSSLNATIAGQSTYTLTCVDKIGTARSQSVTVNLVPETIEQ